MRFRLQTPSKETGAFLIEDEGSARVGAQGPHVDHRESTRAGSGGRRRGPGSTSAGQLALLPVDPDASAATRAGAARAAPATPWDAPGAARPMRVGICRSGGAAAMPVSATHIRQ